MSDFDTYQTSVGEEQGGGRLFIKETGIVDFYDTDFYGARLKYQFLSADTVTRHSMTVGASALSGATALTPAYGTHLIRGSAAAVSTNINICSANAGAKLVINGSEITALGVLKIQCSVTGVSVQGVGGSQISFIKFSNAGKITLVCATAGIWTIVDCNGALPDYV